MTDEHAATEHLACARCGKILQPGSGNFYRVSIEAVADPTFSAEDLNADLRREIERQLARLEGVSDQEAMDQVCRRLLLYLCSPCYRRWMADPTGSSPP
jgi:hypothetical protein